MAAFILVLLALRLLHKDSGAAQVSVATAPASAAASTAAGGSSTAPAATTPRRMLVVDVAGEVRRPGVYRVPAGARVDTAVQQAGGITRHGEGTAVNLAMPLHDGQQVVVPRRGAVAVASAGGGGTGGGAAAGTGGVGAVPMQPISLSTATVEQLDTLDGIGPTLAGRIVQYREAHGGFRSVGELRQVDGIGDKRFESLQKAVEP